MDHAGPFLGKYFLVVVDAHSKWLDVVLIPSTIISIATIMFYDHIWIYCLVSPSVEAKVQSCQERQKSTYDHHSKERSWKLGDLVFVKILAGGDAWLPGKIADITGPVSYKDTLIENELFDDMLITFFLAVLKWKW